VCGEFATIGIVRSACHVIVADTHIFVAGRSVREKIGRPTILNVE
jgi:hypothetical protein